MENVGIFYGHILLTIWYNIWPFGIVCGHLYTFAVLVCLDQEKSGNPDPTKHRLPFVENPGTIY
jgi:hypothetical protein